jgi:hypothetical protein
VARPLDTAPPGERGSTPISSYRSQLAQVPTSIVSKHLIDRYSRIDVRRERFQDALAVSRHDAHRLRRHRTNTSPNPRRHCADREVLRLNCTPDFAGRRINSHNRERSSLNGHRLTVTVLASFANTRPSTPTTPDKKKPRESDEYQSARNHRRRA